MLKQSVGIKNYAVFLPPQELVQAEIVERAQGEMDTARRLGVQQKRLALDSDNTLTLGVSCLQALTDFQNVGALYLGTETPVYSVGNTAAAMAGFAGLEAANLKTADMEFACRAGTLAMINAIGHVSAFKSNAIAVAADKASGQPGDVLAMTTGAGAAAFTITANLNEAVAEIKGVYSYTERRSDFWRPTDENHPRHAGRYSNQSYLEVLEQSLNGFLDSHKVGINDFDHVILHQPNARLPQQIAQTLGITPKQLELGLCFRSTGNLYAAMVPYSLAVVLSQVRPQQNILVASYGSGAGSDVLWIKTTEALEKYQRENPLTCAHTLNVSKS